MANGDSEDDKKAAEDTASDEIVSTEDDEEDEFAAFEAEAKAAAARAMGNMGSAVSAESGVPEEDEDDDEEDDFAAFEAEAKAAAAKAMGGMSGGAAASASGDTADAADDVEDDEDEEDDFAAFEAAAKAAAAGAMANMGGGAAGSGTAESSAPAQGAAPAETDADKTEASADTAESEQSEAAPVADDAKSAAVAAASANLKAASARLFGKTDGMKSQTILVVGGGIAGVTAALEAAETGYDVILLEKEAYLGGRVTRLNRYFPKMCHPTCGLEINYQRIKRNPRLKVMTMAEVQNVTGSRGDYTVSVKTTPRYTKSSCDGCGLCAEAVETEVDNPFNYGMDKAKTVRLSHEHAYPMAYVIDPSVIGTPEADKIKDACPKDAVDFDQKEETFDLNIGAIIWATGWKPYDASKIEVYSYDKCDDIINNVEMERLANHDGPTAGKILRPSNGEEVKKVAMIQCAGSRDINHLPYCSMICCLASLKHAAYVREQYADAQIDIYYIDIRAHDKMSQFYERIKRDNNINFIKSKPGHILVGDNGRPVVCGEHTIEAGLYENDYDLVVLATGMQPSMDADFAPADLTKDEFGFVVPSNGGGEGQFSAGVAGGPFDVALSNQSATAAALKAIQAVRAGS